MCALNGKFTKRAIPYELPLSRQVPERLSSVQTVLYLIFNEGYAATSGDRLVRLDLCAEAIRRGASAARIVARRAGISGLLALMLLHHSRRDARAQNGRLVTLEEQDPSFWHPSEIEEALRLLDKSLGRRRSRPDQLQAAIAALHAQARTPEETGMRAASSKFTICFTRRVPTF